MAFAAFLPLINTAVGMLTGEDQAQKNKQLTVPTPDKNLRMQVVQQRLDESNPMPLIQAGLSALSKQPEDSQIRKDYEPVLQETMRRIGMNQTRQSIAK